MKVLGKRVTTNLYKFYEFSNYFHQESTLGVGEVEEFLLALQTSISPFSLKFITVSLHMDSWNLIFILELGENFIPQNENIEKLYNWFYAAASLQQHLEKWIPL